MSKRKLRAELAQLRETQEKYDELRLQIAFLSGDLREVMDGLDRIKKIVGLTDKPEPAAEG